MDRITIVAAYYEQPSMIEEWWNVLRDYGDITQHVSLRLCDDCSKEWPLRNHVPKDIKETFDIEAFRLKRDWPWQEMRCRNLCMKHVDGWALLLDPDYMIQGSEMRKLLEMPKKQRHIYQPDQRIVETHAKFGRSGNLYLIHQADFWAAGGYDEQFAGGYGFSDAVFWRCVESVAKCEQHLLEDIFMDHYPMGGHIEDAASPGIRDVTRNRPIFEAVIQKMRHMGDSGYISQREIFDYDWERTV
jgi:hypothetical protein